MEEHALWSGSSFGVASAAITTLGLIIGLYAGTNSLAIVLSGILTIAIADAFSDALGVHLSQEATGTNSSKVVWQSTVITFFTKLLFALTFIIPFLFLAIELAIFVCVVWGFVLIGVLSYLIAKNTKQNPLKVIAEHYLIMVIVLILANLAGQFINNYFKI
jgi:vacuolar iron transporter family protein